MTRGGLGSSMVRLRFLLPLSFPLCLSLNTHPSRDINTHQATIMDVLTNVFCASGMHLPSGSYVTFGGNGAVGPGGQHRLGTQPWRRKWCL